MYTPQIITRIEVIEDKLNSNYFSVIGYISTNDDYYYKVIVVDNHNIKGEVRVRQSSCLDSEIEVAIKMANLCVDTINQAIIEKMKRAEV